jgi:hypothetical protein
VFLKASDNGPLRLVSRGLGLNQVNPGTHCCSRAILDPARRFAGSNLVGLANDTRTGPRHRSDGAGLPLEFRRELAQEPFGAQLVEALCDLRVGKAGVVRGASG